jgi:hypothetical protein
MARRMMVMENHMPHVRMMVSVVVVVVRSEEKVQEPGTRWRGNSKEQR